MTTISTRVERRSSSTAKSPTTYKFPDLADDALLHHTGETAIAASRSPSPRPFPLPNHLHSHERWQARRDSRANGNSGWGSGGGSSGYGVGSTRHGRQKSLSEAIRTIRTRKGSVSQSAHEIADSLKAPVSGKLIFLCGVWYLTSILSNTSSKSILTAFPKPVTLTVVQFMFVCSWCLLLSWLARMHAPLRNAVPALRNGIRKPSRELILTTLPLTAFQIGGHILSSDAMSRIPVSLVHTIKGLSPLLTVLAYRFIFKVHYSVPTYLSLIPLTLGVVLACSASFKGNILGLLYALGSALLFVTQNIVSKSLFNAAAKADADGTTPLKLRKPDKLNLLAYSSGLAFLLTLPIWLYSEGLALIADFLADASLDLSQRPGSLDHGRLALEFLFNGSFHFGQNIVAFVLLGLVSPVTYSVASLIKRVFVIVFAVLWFRNPISGVQGFGIALTALGLYLYDRTNDAARADKKARIMQERGDSLLPTAVTGVNTDAKRNDDVGAPVFTQSPGAYAYALPSPLSSAGTMNGYAANGEAGARPQSGSPASWLPPGTRAEDTWTQEDYVARGGMQAQSLGVR